MRTFRIALPALACLGLLLFSLASSANAALSAKDKAFLNSLGTPSASLETPSLGASRHHKKVQARLINELKNPTPSAKEDLNALCLYEGNCLRRRRRVYYRGRRDDAHWFVWRGWITWGSAYASAFFVGITGLAVGAGNAILSPSAGAYFGMMLVPVVGPLVSFIIAMANVRGATDDVWWILGGLGALTTFIPQVVGMAFLIVGYTALSRYHRARRYGDSSTQNKPSWAITPYVDPTGAGVAVFGRF